MFLDLMNESCYVHLISSKIRC